MIQETYAVLMDWHMRSRGFRRDVRDGVAVWVKGDGPAIVLLHGALSRGGTTWGWVSPALAKRFRVIVPDLPGFADSRGSLRTHEVTIRNIARTLCDVLPVWTGGLYGVVGESLGGWIAARMALTEPEQINRLMLVNAAGYWGDRHERAARSRGELIVPHDQTTLEELFSRVTARRVRLPRFVAKDMLHTYRHENGAWRNIIRHGEEDVLTSEELASLRMPVDVVWGENDELLTTSMGRALAAAVPGATWTILPGVAHVPPVEDSKGFVTVVTRLIGAGGSPC